MLKKRDTAILLVALVVILVSVRPSRKFEMKPTWRIAIDRENYANNLFPGEPDKIPPPVLVDLDGDGINEIIFANNRGVVNIYDASDSSKINVIPDYMGSNAGSVPELGVKSALSTLRPYGGFSGRKPVAIAAGYIDEVQEGITRKPVIVIVTDGWNVMCFDHTLKLMWETTTRLDMSTSFFHKEIAISITPTPLRFEDRGLIVISARLSALNTDPLGHEHFSTDNQANPIDLIEGDEIEFKNDEKINLRGFEGDDDDDDDTHLGRRKSDFASAEKDEGHLSYYAFEGHTGALRWKHEQGDFEDTSAEGILRDVMGDEFDVASSYEMRANLVDNIKHVGEMDWREFKPYVLKNLPHVWRSRDDSKLSFDRFERRRSVGASEKTPGSWTTRDLGFSSDVMGRFLSMIGSNTFVDEPGVNKKPPNVIISHSLSGIEVIHLYSGRQLCSLDLAKLRTFDDINADGTLDQIEAFDRYTQKLTKNKVKKQRCFAVASSGVPAVENLWNGSICRLDNLQALRSLNFQDLISSPSENVKIATPAVIPTINDNRQRDSLFLVSTGRVTSYAPDGSLNWQITTPSTWGGKTKKSKQQSLSLDTAFMPSINPLSLDVNSFPSHVLAVGSSKFTVLETETGTIVYTGSIESGVPVANPIIADWNSDGFNDILLTTNTGIYGYELQISQSQLLFPILVITLLLIIVILSFLTHASPSLHGRR